MFRSEGESSRHWEEDQHYTLAAAVEASAAAVPRLSLNSIQSSSLNTLVIAKEGAGNMHDQSEFERQMRDSLPAEAVVPEVSDTTNVRGELERPGSASFLKPSLALEESSGHERPVNVVPQGFSAVTTQSNIKRPTSNGVAEVWPLGEPLIVERPVVDSLSVPVDKLKRPESRSSSPSVLQTIVERPLGGSSMAASLPHEPEAADAEYELVPEAADVEYEWGPPEAADVDYELGEPDASLVQKVPLCRTLLMGHTLSDMSHINSTATETPEMPENERDRAAVLRQVNELLNPASSSDQPPDAAKGAAAPPSQFNHAPQPEELQHPNCAKRGTFAGVSGLATLIRRWGYNPGEERREIQGAVESAPIPVHAD